MNYLADLAIAESKHEGAAAAAVAAAKSKAISSFGTQQGYASTPTAASTGPEPQTSGDKHVSPSGFDHLSAALAIATGSPRVPTASSSGPRIAQQEPDGTAPNPAVPASSACEPLQFRAATTSAVSALAAVSAADTEPASSSPPPSTTPSPPSEQVPFHREGRYMLRFKLQGQSIAARLTDKVHVGRLLTRAEKVERRRVDVPRNIAYEIPSAAGGLVACQCCMRAAKQAERHGGNIYAKGGGRMEHLKDMILSGHQEPVRIASHPDKGRILLTEGVIEEGEFVMEYVGQLIDEKEALRREQLYSQANCGSYMFFFEHNGRTHCIDATAELPVYGNGRLLSHSRANPNLKPEKVVIAGVPRLCLVAKHTIYAGTELQYDYGERDPETLKHFTWLASS